MIRVRPENLRFVVLVVGFLLAAPLLSIAQEDTSQEAQNEPTQEEVVARYERDIANFERMIAEDPDHPTAWAMLVQTRGFHRMVTRKEKGTREESIEFHRRLYQEWMDAQPWNGGAYIGYSATLPAEERIGYLIESLERAPASSELLQMTFMNLKAAGRVEATLELGARFLENNPTDPKGYELVYRNFEARGNGEEAARILERWLEAVPGDGPALVSWSRKQMQRLGTPEARRAHAEEIARRVTPGTRGLSVCRTLEQHPDLALECFSRALETDLEENARKSAQTSLLKLATKEGLADFDDVFEQLDPHYRGSVLASVAAGKAAQGLCGEALGLLERHPVSGGVSVFDLAAVHADCADGGSLEARWVALLPQLDQGTFRNLIQNWQAQRPFDFLEGEAFRRLASESPDHQLLKALDGLYAKAGRSEKRLELFETWGDRIAGNDFYKYGPWVDLLKSLGETEKLEELLVRLTRDRKTGSEGHLATLAELYIAQSRFDSAEKAIDDLRRQEEATKAKTLTSELLGARLSWARGDTQTAEAGYWQYLESSLAFHGSALREYSYLLASDDRLPELFTALEKLYGLARAKRNTNVTGSRETWVAGHLEEIYLLEPALEYIKRAAQDQPRDGTLQERRYKLASDLEQWDEAEAAATALVELDPQNAQSWNKLATAKQKQTGPAAALDVLSAMPQGVGQSTSARMKTATTLIETGRLVEGIRIMREVRRERPRAWSVQEQLSKAYIQLTEREEAGDAPQ